MYLSEASTADRNFCLGYMMQVRLQLPLQFHSETRPFVFLQQAAFVYLSETGLAVFVGRGGVYAWDQPR